MNYLTTSKFNHINLVTNSSRKEVLKKSNLPQKICPICMRPFHWRKKWRANWNNVIYCSKKCKLKKKPRP